MDHLVRLCHLGFKTQDAGRNSDSLALALAFCLFFLLSGGLVTDAAGKSS